MVSSITGIDLSHSYLIRLPFVKPGLVESHCYALCAEAYRHAADAKYFCIDYTSGINSNANATVWVCACLKCVLGVREKFQRFVVKAKVYLIIFEHMFEVMLLKEINIFFSNICSYVMPIIIPTHSRNSNYLAICYVKVYICQNDTFLNPYNYW